MTGDRMEGRRFTVRGEGFDCNEGFVCSHCGQAVPPLAAGCRNHCPRCLHSVHLDVFPGDRGARCGGLMVPTRVLQHSKKGWIVEHRCARCGARSTNKLSLSDASHPDSLDAVLSFMRAAALKKSRD